MIDISNVVLRHIREAVTSEYANCECLSYNPDTISAYPCVTVSEMDNYTYEESLDDSNSEHHAVVVFEINAYSNNSAGTKSEAKKIMNIVDNTMLGLRFTRTLKTELPNKDRSVYRVYARYKAVVSAGTDIGGDTIHQVYRR